MEIQLDSNTRLTITNPNVLFKVWQFTGRLKLAEFSGYKGCNKFVGSYTVEPCMHIMVEYTYMSFFNKIKTEWINIDRLDIIEETII